jgi:hypothetical protein
MCAYIYVCVQEVAQDCKILSLHILIIFGSYFCCVSSYDFVK